MVKYWKYALVAVLAFAIGTTMVASAAGIQRFVLSDRYGMNTARILPGGRLVVDATRSIVGVKNFPDVQEVDGEVSVGNLPDVQTVAGDVEVMNFPEVQTVEGTVAVDNLPDVQEVAGEINVANLPLTADGRVKVAPPVPEATLLMSFDTELTTTTEAVSPWVPVQGYTRFLLFSGIQHRPDPDSPDSPGLYIRFSFHESADGVTDYGSVDALFAGQLGTQARKWLWLNEDGSPCSAELCPRIQFWESKRLSGDFLYLNLSYEVSGGHTAALPATIEAKLYGLP